MKNFLLALAGALALLCPFAAFGQQQVVTWNGRNPSAVSGTLTTVTTDSVPADLSGSAWATARFTATTAGTATATAQISLDGTNWIPSAYAKRLSTVNTSPTVQAISATTLAKGDVWEVPLPGNARHFRVLCAGSGTTTSLTVYGGVPVGPGVSVKATLFDVATTGGVANNTGTLDVSGWNAVGVDIVVTSATTGAASLNEIDDAGAAIAVGTSGGILVGTYAFGWGGSYSFGTANPFTMAGAITSAPLPPRISIATAGATTSAQRIRVWATR